MPEIKVIALSTLRFSAVMFRRLVCGAILLIIFKPSGGHLDSPRNHRAIQIDVILTTAGATLVVFSAVACGICFCYQRKKFRRQGDAESPNTSENIEMVIRKISVENGATSSADDDVTDSRTHRQPMILNLVSGSAYDSSCGLGFNICGNHHTGAIFVSEVLKNGPAKVSGKLHPGDRLLSLKVSTKCMELEDAMTILSYAAPYPVELCVQPATESFRTSKDLVGMSSSAGDTLRNEPRTGVRRVASTCCRPDEELTTGTASGRAAADQSRRLPQRSRSEMSGHSGTRHNIVRLDAEHGVATLTRRQEACSSDDDLDVPSATAAVDAGLASRSRRVLSDSAIDLVTEISMTELNRSGADYATCELHAASTDTGSNAAELSDGQTGQGRGSNKNKRRNQWIVEKTTRSMFKVAEDSGAGGSPVKHNGKTIDDEAADRHGGLRTSSIIIGYVDGDDDDDDNNNCPFERITSAGNQSHWSDQIKPTRLRRWEAGKKPLHSDGDYDARMDRSHQVSAALNVDGANLKRDRQITDESTRGVGDAERKSTTPPTKPRRTVHKQAHQVRTEKADGEHLAGSFAVANDAHVGSSKSDRTRAVPDGREKVQDYVRAIVRRHDDSTVERSQPSPAAATDVETTAVDVGFISARPKTDRHVLNHSEEVMTDDTTDDESVLQQTADGIDTSQKTSEGGDSATSGIQANSRLPSTTAIENAADFVDIDLNDEQTSVKSHSGDITWQKSEVHSTSAVKAFVDGKRGKSSVDIGLKFKNFWTVGSLDRQPKRGVQQQVRRDSADVNIRHKDRIPDVGIRRATDNNNNDDDCHSGGTVVRTGYVMAFGKGRVKPTVTSGPNPKLAKSIMVSNGVKTERKLSAEKPVGKITTALREHATIETETDYRGAVKTSAMPLRSNGFDCGTTHVADDAVGDTSNETASKADAEDTAAAAAATATDMSRNQNLQTSHGQNGTTFSKQITSETSHVLTDYADRCTTTSEKSSNNSNERKPLAGQWDVNWTASHGPADGQVDNEVVYKMEIEPVLFRAPRRSRSRSRSPNRYSGVVQAPTTSHENVERAVFDSSCRTCSEEGSPTRDESRPTKEIIKFQSDNRNENLLSGRQSDCEMMSGNAQFHATTSLRKSAAAATGSIDLDSQLGNVSTVERNLSETVESSMSNGQRKTTPQRIEIIDRGVMLSQMNDLVIHGTSPSDDDVTTDVAPNGAVCRTAVDVADLRVGVQNATTNRTELEVKLVPLDIEPMNVRQSSLFRNADASICNQSRVEVGNDERLATDTADDTPCGTCKYHEQNSADITNDLNNNDLDHPSSKERVAPPTIESDTLQNLCCALPPEAQRARQTGEISVTENVMRPAHVIELPATTVDSPRNEHLKSCEIANVIDFDDTGVVDRSFSMETEANSSVGCVLEQLMEDDDGDDEHWNFLCGDFYSRHSVEPIIDLAELNSSLDDINNLETHRTPSCDHVSSSYDTSEFPVASSSPSLKVSRLMVDLKPNVATSNGECRTSPEVNSRRRPPRRKIVCITHQMAPSE